MPHVLSALYEQKAQLRAAMRAQRRAHADVNDVLTRKMIALFLEQVSVEKDAVVSGYQAFRDEIDPAPLLESLRARGHRIALPVIVGKKMPLAFRLHHLGDGFVTNDMGIREPADDPALAVEPDILLVPLLAFDRNRNRLGYGGGYYDRTLAGLRQRKKITAIGIAYAYQEVPHLPVGEHDIRLDKIVTDVNVF